jgi:hypothetical protein
MSKAEKRACQYTGYCRNQSYSDFLNGYHQAETDLELTWEDVSKIRQIMFDYNRQLRPEIVENKASLPKDEEYCREVLNRFKKGKG